MPGATLAPGILYLEKPSEKPLEPAVNSATLTRQASSKCSRCALREQNTQSSVPALKSLSPPFHPLLWQVKALGCLLRWLRLEAIPVVFETVTPMKRRALSYSQSPDTSRNSVVQMLSLKVYFVR